MTNTSPAPPSGKPGLAQWVRRNKVLAAVIGLGGIFLMASHKGSSMSASTSPSDTTPGSVPTAGYASGTGSDPTGAWYDPGSANSDSTVTPGGVGGDAGSDTGGSAGDGTTPQPGPVTIDIGTPGTDASPDGTTGAARNAARVNHKKIAKPGRRVPGKGRRKGSVAHSTHRTTTNSHAHQNARAQHHTNAANHHAARAQHHAAKAVQHQAASHGTRPAPHPATHPTVEGQQKSHKDTSRAHQSPPIHNNGGAPAPRPVVHHTESTHHSAPKKKRR